MRILPFQPSRKLKKDPQGMPCESFIFVIFSNFMSAFFSEGAPPKRRVFYRFRSFLIWVVEISGVRGR